MPLDAIPPPSAPASTGVNDWITVPAASTAPAAKAAADAPPKAEVDDWITVPEPEGQIDSEGNAVSPDELKRGAAFARPFANIVGAGVQGAEEGFGSQPLGMSQQTQDALTKAGVFNGPDEYNPLKGINKALVGGGAAAADLAGRAVSGLFRGGQAAVAQTGAELGAPLLGRDIAALPEAFMGEPGMLVAPSLVPEGRAITAREVQARDGVPIMEAWKRANAENTGRAAGAVADIGKAPDIDGAIAAAGKAAQTPGAADVGAMFPEPAPVPAVPEPQSVGAAASREGTAPSVADLSTADMKANRRTAEMDEILAPPQAGDTMIHVPGSFPTLAESSGDPVVSHYENLLRQRNPGEFIGEGKRLTENNNARVAEFDNNTVSDTTLNSMRRDREEQWIADSEAILPAAKPINLAPALDWVTEQLSNPRIQENDAVKNVLADFQDRIIDDDGNLKTNPAAAWGIHDHLQNQLAKAKDPLNATGAEKFAESQILTAKQLIDQAMNVATDNRFQSALDRYAENSKAINSGTLLNDFRPKLTNMTGELQAANFHRFVAGLAKERGDPGIDPSMDISDQTMRSLINIDTDLKRAGLIKLGAAAGSPTNLLGALAEKAGLSAAHEIVGKIPVVGGLLSEGQKYLAQRKLFADTAKHLAPPDGGYTYPSAD